MVNSVNTVGSEYVTPTEAARILGVSRPTIYRMMEDGILPYTQVKGVNKRKLRRADVERLIKLVDKRDEPEQ